MLYEYILPTLNINKTSIYSLKPEFDLSFGGAKKLHILRSCHKTTCTPKFDNCVSDWPSIAVQGEGCGQLTQVTCRHNRPAPATCDFMAVIGQLQPVLACDWLGHYWASSVRHRGSWVTQSGAVKVLSEKLRILKSP